MGEKVDNYRDAKGMEDGNRKVIYLVLHLFLGAVGSCTMMQNDFNTAA